MTAKITLSFSPDLLKLLAKSKSLKLSLAGANGRAAPTRAALKSRGEKPGPKAKAPGDYRPGSHSANLVAWASGRKRPFGVAETMKRLKVNRGHASMVLSKLVKDRKLRREGRGEYGAA